MLYQSGGNKNPNPTTDIQGCRKTKQATQKDKNHTLDKAARIVPHLWKSILKQYYYFKQAQSHPQILKLVLGFLLILSFYLIVELK